jgi:peroxiredoxin Q/BCP
MTDSSATAPSAIGLTVPEFSAAATGGDFKLANFRGKSLAIYFYPKDSTPGCTTEAMQFRDQYGAFNAAGCVVVGVSRDSLKSHESFKSKLGLPFELISDGDEAVCRLFDVIKTKNMYGKQVQGIERSTFLIDATSVLRCEWRKVKAEGHAGEVLAAAKALSA